MKKIDILSWFKKPVDDKYYEVKLRCANCSAKSTMQIPKGRQFIEHSIRFVRKNSKVANAKETFSHTLVPARKHIKDENKQLCNCPHCLTPFLEVIK